MNNLFTGHNCNECHVKGHCSLEIAVRFFNEHQEMMDELDSLRKMLGNWRIALMADAATSMDNTPSYVIEVAMATGFVLARGAEPLNIDPSMEDVLESIKNLVVKMQLPPFATEDNLN